MKRPKDTAKESFEFVVLNDQSPCSLQQELFTEEELELLAELKRIKLRARALRGRLIGTLNAPRARELETLRIEWREKMAAYREAARRRMIALGHEEPEEPS